MVLSNMSGTVTGFGEHSWKRKRNDIQVRAEFVKVMLVSILSVLVIVKSRHHNRPTRTATGRRCKGIAKDHAVFCQKIDVGRDRCLISITAERLAFVIGDKKDDVFISR